MEFSNAATKSSYRPTVEKDRKVYVPGTDQHGSYSGMLSDITPDVAETMVSHGVNILTRVNAVSVKKSGEQ